MDRDGFPRGETKELVEGKPIRVLLVEDNASDARLVKEMLVAASAYWFRVEEAGQLSEALALLAERSYDVILLDLSLPDVQGLDTLIQTRDVNPSVPIVVLSGLSDEDLAIRAVRESAQDYLVKGQVTSNLLARSIRQAIERKRAEEALRESEARFRLLADNAQDLIFRYELKPVPKFTYLSPSVTAITGYTAEEFSVDSRLSSMLIFSEDDPSSDGVFEAADSANLSLVFPLVRKDGKTIWTEQRNTKVYGKAGNLVAIEGIARDITDRKTAEDDLKRSNESLHLAMEGTILATSLMVEMRDPYTAGHQRGVSALSCAIAKEMGLPPSQIEGVRLGGLVHDIGKISTPAELLSKPGRLSEIEMSLIKTHPSAGYELLRTIEFDWPIALIAFQHHERMNGSGYPIGLVGKEILMEARIMAVADVLEAMSSHRPYRTALDKHEALREIIQNRGILYDSEVVDAAAKVISSSSFALATFR